MGFRSDLAVLKNDPSKNIQALTDVQCTLRDGKIIYRAAERDWFCMRPRDVSSLFERSGGRLTLLRSQFQRVLTFGCPD